MLRPLNKEAAFQAIADDLELPLVLLANPDPRVRLVQLEKIGAALASTNLTFRDLAERVVAIRPAVMEPVVAAPAPMPKTPWPTSEIQVNEPGQAAKLYRSISAESVLTNDELRQLGGYRTGPVPPEMQSGDAAVLADSSQIDVAAELRAFGNRDSSAPFFGRYGYGPVPDACETIPGESLDAAGERIANWALAKSGQPFWEDPETGRGYLPRVTVLGKGKVREDGTLGPIED